MSAAPDRGAGTGGPPTFDPVAGRLRCSPRQLAVMADLALADGPRPPHEVLAPLKDAGIVAIDGEVVPELRPVATAAATARAALRVSRQRGEVLREVQVRAGPDGVLLAPAGDHDAVGEVVLVRPFDLARTLWRLGHIAPRGAVATRELTVEATALFDGIRSGEAPWRDELGVADAALTRFEVHTDPEGAPVVTTLLDTTAGCWRVDGDSEPATLVPVRPLDVLEDLTRWQRAIVGPDGEEGEGRLRTATREVAVGDLSVRVPVPSLWETLDPAEGFPLLARQVATDGFAANVTVVPLDAPGGPEGDERTSIEAGEDPHDQALRFAVELAAGLEGGSVVDAWSLEGGDAVLVVVHAAPWEDVVAVQRRVSDGPHAAAVTYTCAVGQWASWGPKLLAWAEAVTR